MSPELIPKKMQNQSRSDDLRPVPPVVPRPAGKYMYCVVEGTESKSFGSLGLGEGASEAGSEVYTVSAEGLSCVVSDSAVKEYDMSRENLLKHQKVNERVMQEGVVLPVKFCTISENRKKIIEKFLKPRAEELRSKIAFLRDKQEYGVRAFWKEMKQVYAWVVEENPKLKRKRDQINSRPNARDQAIQLGQEVKRVLDQKKEQMALDVFEALKGLAHDAKQNEATGDRMVLNDAFLIEQATQAAFDQKVSELSETYKDILTFKYVGPVPPANFVEIVVTWDEDG